MAASDSDPETDSGSESESEGDDDIKLSKPSKTAIYNKEGTLDKLNDIFWPEDIDWTHKLSLEIPQEDEIDVNDDLARELAFYNQALQGTCEAFVKFETMKLPFLRPSDYYAEMVKTDSHMRQQSGFAEKDSCDIGFEDGKGSERVKKGNKRKGVSPWDRTGGKGKREEKGGGGSGKRKSREFRDSKYGFGGKKGMKKQNTLETTNNFKGFGKRDSRRSKNGKSDSGSNKKRRT
ncbi:hypothetical protein LXL04_017177 [Taraxacum kok-saghyz]